MAKQLQIRDFPLDLADHIQVFDGSPVEDFDGHLGAGEDVLAIYSET